MAAIADTSLLGMFRSFHDEVMREFYFILFSLEPCLSSFLSNFELALHVPKSGEVLRAEGWGRVWALE